MEPKKRLWIGVTLLVVILFNYILIGAPLLSKSYSINQKSKAILIKGSKPAGIFAGADDEYLLDVFRKERSLIDTRMTILNAAAATLTFFVLSWTLFGLVFKRK